MDHGVRGVRRLQGAASDRARQGDVDMGYNHTWVNSRELPICMILAVICQVPDCRCPSVLRRRRLALNQYSERVITKVCQKLYASPQRASACRRGKREASVRMQ